MIYSELATIHQALSGDQMIYFVYINKIKVYDIGRVFPVKPFSNLTR